MNIIPYTENMKITNNCFVTDMPEHVYHSWPNSISKSGLDDVNQSLKHYAFKPAKESTRAMVIGTAIHRAILEPKKFESNYLLLKNVKDRKKTEYKQAIKTHDESLVLTTPESENVKLMQESVLSSGLMPKKYMAELSGFATDPQTGVLLRIRIDILTHDGSIIDLKKTQKSDRESFSKSCANYRYHVQDAFYSYVYSLIAGQKPKSFKFLAVEENIPNEPMMHELCEVSKFIGAEEFRKNLDDYANALKTNEWSGYQKTDEPLSLPHWYITQHEYKEVDEIV